MAGKSGLMSFPTLSLERFFSWFNLGVIHHAWAVLRTQAREPRHPHHLPGPRRSELVCGFWVGSPPLPHDRQPWETDGLPG